MQILLEVCLPTAGEEQGPGSGGDSLLHRMRGNKAKSSGDVTAAMEEEEEEEEEGGLLSNLREVQCLICCLLHQMFIADPNIAKLVHFQV